MSKQKLCNLLCFVLTVITLLLLEGCVSDVHSSLKNSLKLAGDNRRELEKVLEHYEGDTLKLEAAKFLITNMCGAFSRSEKVVDLCAPFYDEYNRLAAEYNYTMTAERGRKIDSLWSDFYNQHPQLHKPIFQLDLETITAEQLISEIDLAFRAWQENVYMKDGSFDDFCEYILPYRRANGLIIDDARNKIYNRHKGQYFSQSGKDMIDEVDSLLYIYRYITHSQFWGTRIPILCASTLEYMRHGLCRDRCWYNSLLLSSLGMAVAIDFVPVWGNRNNNHTWNVLIKNGTSYAFESFWDKDRWKYKRIYNNKTFDTDWGRFRLAKVYRETYKNFFEGPITDNTIRLEDIPPFFRDFKKKDVSHEYFDTVDVTISLTDIPRNTHYAYLCVWNFHDWQPVQWGKINRGEVTFKEMGKDVVYLPCYYSNGHLVYAGSPFLLNQDGDLEYFDTEADQKEDLYIKHYAGSALHYGNKWNNLSISNTKILGSEEPTFEQSEILCTLPSSIEIYSGEIPVAQTKRVRYIRLTLPDHKLAFSDLSFFQRVNGEKEKISGVQFIKQLKKSENGECPSFIFDEYKATGYTCESNADFIDIDLGAEYQITDISYTPYFEAGLKEDLTFELFYWNKGWVSLGEQNGSNSHIVFENVPKNALFILKHPDRNNKPGARPFIYRDHEILWH